MRDECHLPKFLLRGTETGPRARRWCPRARAPSRVANSQKAPAHPWGGGVRGGRQSLREPRAAEQLAMSRTLMEPRATCGPARHRLVAQSLGPVGPGGGGMKPGLGLEVRE